MIRLTIVVEGDSEETLVTKTLAPHLHGHGVFTKAMIVRTRMARPNIRASRGGGRWVHMRNDLQRVLKNDHGPDLRVSTMLDLYHIAGDYPGLAAAQAIPDRATRCTIIENAMRAEINDVRFIPYVQKHEYESLVFCGLRRLVDLADDQRDRESVEALMGDVAGIEPEDINDGDDTAPSRRLQATLPGYEKVVHGPLVLEAVGLGALRESCPCFNAWVTQLETLKTSIADSVP